MNKLPKNSKIITNEDVKISVDELAGMVARRFDEFGGIIGDKISNLDTKIGKKINGIDIKIDSLDSRVGSLEVKVDNLDSRVGSVETKIDNLETKMDSGFSGLNAQLSSMSWNFVTFSEHNVLKDRVRKIEKS